MPGTRLTSEEQTPKGKIAESQARCAFGISSPKQVHLLHRWRKGRSRSRAAARLWGPRGAREELGLECSWV